MLSTLSGGVGQSALRVNLRMSRVIATSTVAAASKYTSLSRQGFLSQGSFAVPYVSLHSLSKPVCAVSSLTSSAKVSIASLPLQRSFSTVAKLRQWFRGNPADRIEGEVVVDVKPLRWIYRSATPGVKPINPADVGEAPSLFLLAIISMSIAMSILWNYFSLHTSLVMSLPKDASDALKQELNNNNKSDEVARFLILRKYLSNASESVRKAVCVQYDRMLEFWTSNVQNLKERKLTIFTSTFSHTSLNSFLWEAAGFCIFGHKLYAFLGPVRFAGLFLTAAAATTCGEAAYHIYKGRVTPSGGTKGMLLDRTPEQQERYLATTADLHACGMSGIVFACMGASLAFFPHDVIGFRYLAVTPAVIVAYYAAHAFLMHEFLPKLKVIAYNNLILQQERAISEGKEPAPITKQMYDKVFPKYPTLSPLTTFSAPANLTAFAAGIGYAALMWYKPWGKRPAVAVGKLPFLQEFTWVRRVTPVPRKVWGGELLRTQEAERRKMSEVIAKAATAKQQQQQQQQRRGSGKK